MASPEDIPAAIRVGDVFGRARDLFAAHWIACFVIGVLGYLPLGALTAAVLTPPVMRLLVDETLQSTYAADIMAVVGVAWFVLALICIVLSAAIIILAMTKEMSGRGFTPIRAALAILRRTPVIVATIVLVLGATLAGVAILLIPGLVVLCVLAVAIPASLAENLGPIQSLRRSAFLTKGNRWRILAILILLEVGGLALSELAGSGLELTFGTLASLFLRLPFDAAIHAFIAVAIGVLYMKLRIAREGPEVDQIAQLFD